MGFTGSRDIVDVDIARRYLRARMHDAVACWAAFSQQERDALNVVTFAQYLARYW